MFEFLGGAEVTLAYYLFKLFSVQAALFIAWGQWQRHTSFRARRLTVAFGSLVLLQVALLFVSLLSTGPNSLSPPLERIIGVTSLGLLVWGFSPILRERETPGLIFLVTNTILAFLLLPTSIVGSSGPDFNQSGWETFFIIWQVALLIFGIINCFRRLDDERLYVLFSFSLMLIGYLGHFWFANDYVQPDIPLLVRLSEMIAYPLLTVAIYQGAMQSLAARTQTFQSLSEVSLDQIKALNSLFEATTKIVSSLELSKVTEEAVQHVARALDADQCALAMPDDEENLSQLRLVAIHNPHRRGRGEAVSFPLSEQPAIKHVINNKQHIQVDEYQDDSHVRMLFTLMGADEAGPLLAQPLFSDDRVIGVLILGNSVSKSVFTTVQIELSRSLADQIAVSIRHAKIYKAASKKVEQLSWTLRNHELDTGKRQAAMETQLRKSREEVAMFSNRLLEHEMAQRDKEEALKQATDQINKLKKMVDRAKIEVDKANRKEQQLTNLANEADQYRQQIDRLAEENQSLHQKLQHLADEAAEAERLSDTLEATNRRVRKLARALKKARSQIQATPLLASLSRTDNSEFEKLAYGVIIGDAHHNVSRINQAALELLTPETPASITGQPLTTIAADERWQQAIGQLRHHHEPFVTTQFQAKDNILRATISPLISTDNGTFEGAIIVVYDVTTEFESQQAKDEFVASLSQDLRTPMTSISGYTELLLGETIGQLGEMQRRFLQRIKANVERMRSMVNDLISLTTIDAGQLEVHPTPIDLTEVIEDMLISKRVQLEEKQISFELQFVPDMPMVEVDPDSVQQIMNNLLENAIKVTPDEGVITITTAFHNEQSSESNNGGQFLAVSVTDSGGGIADKDMPRVFDRFYRAVDPLIQGLGETGVGLAIVKTLVEANGGQIWVDSEIGEGTIFSFTLPISAHSDDPWSSFLGTLPPLDLSPG